MAPVKSRNAYKLLFSLCCSSSCGCSTSIVYLVACWMIACLSKGAAVSWVKFIFLFCSIVRCIYSSPASHQLKGWLNLWYSWAMTQSFLLLTGYSQPLLQFAGRDLSKLDPWLSTVYVWWAIQVTVNMGGSRLFTVLENSFHRRILLFYKVVNDPYLTIVN